MNAIRNWTLLIAGFAVLMSCMEAIMPRGVMRKYLRLVIALMMTLAMLAPFAKLAFDRPFAQIPEIQAQAYAHHEEMEEKQQEDVLRLYQKNLEQKMQTVLENSVGCKGVTVHCEIQSEDRERFGYVDAVTVCIDSKLGKDCDGVVKECLKEQFEVGTEKVYIRYLKE